MANTKGKLLRWVENIFAVCVIVVCIFSVMTSLSRYRYPVRQQTKRHFQHALKNERENFRYAMLLARQSKTTIGSKKIIETTLSPSSINKDEFRSWFRDRNVVKHHASKKHPNLKPEVINNIDICKRSSVDILIYFQSHWNHFQRRTILRETWAGTNTFKDVVIKTIFILGKPDTKNKEDQLRINNENLIHHDIIQGQFIDSFSNLTLKTILTLKWINENCIQAKYILKADDDMFVNIFAVIEYLITQIHDKKKTVMCHVKESNTSLLIRDKNSRWYVPNTVWPGRTHYPKFCSGYTALFTGDLIPWLYKASFSAPYFSVDDGYIFGLLMETIADVNYMDIQDYMTLNQKTALDEYTGTGPLLHVAANAWETGYLEKFWQATLSKLTDWAKDHANVAVVQSLRSNIMKKYPTS